MKNILKKIGWFIVSMLPILILLGFQIGCTVVVMIGGMLTFMVQGFSPEEALLQTQQFTMDNLLIIVIVSQLLTALIAGVWYYFVWGKGKGCSLRNPVKPWQILLIPVLGVIIQFMTSSVLTIIEILAPFLMENYIELMEESGLNEVTAVMLISTVLMAPLSEELVCRGLVLRLAMKVSSRFWIVNMIQAFAFGVMHGNVIQGIYAFLLGLVLGYLYFRFGNIWLCMLLHAAMNFSSILVAPVFSLFPEKGAILALTITFFVCTALFVLVMTVIGRTRKS